MTRITGTSREALHAEGMAQESDASLLIPVNASEDGLTSIQLRIMRFDRNGLHLKTFGRVSGSAEGIGLLSDGTVIVHGTARDGRGTEFTAFVRFDSNGALDPGFGDHGILASSTLLAGRIVVEVDDRVIVAAGSELARHHADGELDFGFGVEGFASTPAFTGYDDVVLQPDGKIIAVGGGVTTLRAAAGLDTVCPATVCDVDGSGSIDVTDGVNVLRAAADLPALLSCGVEGP